MAMRCVHATKRERVAEILENDTYMPESGMMKRLTEQLLRLSSDDLGCLQLIIRLKMQGNTKNTRAE